MVCLRTRAQTPPPLQHTDTHTQYTHIHTLRAAAHKLVKHAVAANWQWASAANNMGEHEREALTISRFTVPEEIFISKNHLVFYFISFLLFRFCFFILVLGLFCIVVMSFSPIKPRWIYLISIKNMEKTAMSKLAINDPKISKKVTWKLAKNL